MKIFALTFVAIFLFLGTNSAESEEKWREDIEKWVGQCAEELDISEDKMKEYEDMEEPPMDELGMCLSACILEKAGLIVDGKLHEETMDAVVKEFEGSEGMEGIPEIAQKCYTEANVKTDKCEVAGVLSTCMFEGIKEIEVTT